jgi:hypothetical protein
MSKKHFIALAVEVRGMLSRGEISDNGIKALALWCRDQNAAFMRDRWIGYIYGQNGPSGGRV